LAERRQKERSVEIERADARNAIGERRRQPERTLGETALELKETTGVKGRQALFF
jgi:hypothetical protein